MNDFSISGKWFNKTTGKIINVRDSIIDGDNMIIVTDVGNMNMNEFSDNYIQMSDDIYDEAGHKIDNEKVNISHIEIDNRRVTPAMITRTSMESDELINDTINDSNINNSINVNSTVETIPEIPNIHKPNIKASDDIIQHNRSNAKTTNNELNNSEKLLKKLFEKKNFDKNKIVFNINIESNEFPKEELNMLKLIYDVTDEDIAKYLKKYILDDETIIKSIMNMLAILQ